ncbi:MAG: hypothetical protein FWE13_05245 [Firmicutes bacterium]|nr:hypothetical protein [Bacillota bacterium]
MNRITNKTRIIIFITVFALMFFSVMFLSAGSCDIYIETTEEEVCSCSQLPLSGRFISILEAYNKGYLGREDVKNIAYHISGVPGVVYVVPDGRDCEEMLDWSNILQIAYNRYVVRLMFEPKTSTLPSLDASITKQIKHNFLYMQNTMGYYSEFDIDDVTLEYLGTYNSKVAVVMGVGMLYVPNRTRTEVAGVLFLGDFRAPFFQIWVPN